MEIGVHFNKMASCAFSNAGGGVHGPVPARKSFRRWVFPAGTIYLLIIIFVILQPACMPFMRAPLEPVVILTNQKSAFHMAILLRDEKIKVRIRARDAVPFSSNASAAVWIGINFPYQKAIDVILLARNYYKDLRYLALSNKQSNPPDVVHYQIFIGGSTETALLQGLKAWQNKDFKKLKSIKNEEEFRALIRAKYSPE